MRKTKRPIKRKWRILLDAAFAQVGYFPKLAKIANLAHCVHDCGLSPQIEDEEIFKTAMKEDRFVLTINFKDFRSLPRINKPGVIGVESQLSNEEIDAKVSDFLRDKNPSDYLGKATRIK